MSQMCMLYNKVLTCHINDSINVINTILIVPLIHTSKAQLLIAPLDSQYSSTIIQQVNSSGTSILNKIFVTIV